jgi:class 3 adenylate cyclase/tetratricopeptide (TPR) repeat protein
MVPIGIPHQEKEVKVMAGTLNVGNEDHKIPQDATINLQQRIAKVDDCAKITQELDKKKHIATAVFFDLVGSTGYRHKYNLIPGLEKSYRHNILVSQCAVEHGGHVVKWLGDGVLAIFHGIVNSKAHPYRALLSAVEAFKRLKEYNDSLFAGDDKWEHEIHTRVGISRGDVHFVTVNYLEIETEKKNGDNDTPPRRQITFWDPIGSAVDLAARLQSFAERDVILLDERTFFPFTSKDSIPSVSYTPNGAIEWQKVSSREERHTIYVPETSVFQFGDAAIHFSLELTKNLSEHGPEAAGKWGEILFVTKAIDCNVRGFNKTVQVVAVSLEYNSAPVKSERYEPPSNAKVNRERQLGEQAYRMGTEEEAVHRFQAVLEEDQRNFNAHLRLAQYYRRHGKILESKTHWNKAKSSEPRHPLVWTLAGTTYFEVYLEKTGNGEHESAAIYLSKAIVDLKRATQLAHEAFDCFLEQYCACLLAICYFARAEKDSDYSEGQRIKDELEQWPPLSRTIEVLVNMMKVYAFIATYRKTNIFDIKSAESALHTAEYYFNKSKKHDKGFNGDHPRGDRTEALIGSKYLRHLVTAGRLRLEALNLRNEEHSLF